MAILHGTWSVGGQLLLWGETWRKTQPQPLSPGQPPLTHPLALDLDDLQTLLQSLPTQPIVDRLTPATWQLSIPTAIAKPKKNRKTKTNPDPTPPPLGSLTLTPYHSAPPFGDPEAAGSDLDLDQIPFMPWQVTGFALTAPEAMDWLTTLPLRVTVGDNSPLAGDLRFWAYSARWLLDLLCRGKFLPCLRAVTANQVQSQNQSQSQSQSQTSSPPSVETPVTFQAGWQVVLDSADDRRNFEQFVQEMPQTCTLAYPSIAPHSLNRLPVPPRLLLRHFLNALGDAQVRSTLTPPKVTEFDPTICTWLQGLGSTDPRSADPEQLARLAANLERWGIPLTSGQDQYRTCLILEPPSPDRPTDPWQLHYGLQADDDPSLQIRATEIWQHPVETWLYQGRRIPQPQETLLLGLGLAARLYPRLEPSLDRDLPRSCDLSAEEAFNFIKTVAWRLQDHGLGVVLPESLRGESIANRLGLSVRASLSTAQPGLGLQSLLQFQWELSLGGQTFSKAEFEKLVAQDTPLVQINGEWLELRPQDIKSAREFFKSRKDQPNLSLEDALRISSGDTQTLSKLPVVDFEAAGALQELVTTLSGNQSLDPLPAPAGFRGHLRPYQERGVGWLAFLQRWNLGACLADDMGLGKTIQFLAFLLHLKTEGRLTQPVLLVCPTSVLGNWEREAKKFAPQLRVMIHHGDGRAKGKNLETIAQTMDLILTSYALVYRDLKDLKRVSWQGITLDEAQNIKNAEAKQSQAVRELAQVEVTTDTAASTAVPRFRVALTGTPVENRLGELWAIMDFLNPGYLGPRQFFQRRFTVPIERYGDTASLNTLRSLVQPFILRRLKTDRTIIQDLPEKQEMAVFCSLSEEQAQLYQTVVDETLAAIHGAQGIQRHGLVLGLLTKLKQVCNHPQLFLKETAPKRLNLGEFSQRSAKLQRLNEMLEEVQAEGDRALIFTQFAEWGKWLKAYLEQQWNQEVFFLYGSTSKAQREEMVDRFQQDPQAPRIMILSLKAGGVGLNLTRANHVFHYDRWWNPAVENQATDRAFRIGQTRNVQVHKFVCQGTLEERIHDLIESKKELAEQVVGDGEGWLGNLDTDQLRDLLLLDRSAIIED
ncbi:MAG: DEAD/DEAH box helicase [Prochlorothrix sp.]|nr:DEAD/DEAH box helicase [Prochlorothrix sp.]